jgi:hypothetical protein
MVVVPTNLSHTRFAGIFDESTSALDSDATATTLWWFGHRAVDPPREVVDGEDLVPSTTPPHFARMIEPTLTIGSRPR